VWTRFRQIVRSSAKVLSFLDVFLFVSFSPFPRYSGASCKRPGCLSFSLRHGQNCPVSFAGRAACCRSIRSPLRRVLFSFGRVDFVARRYLWIGKPRGISRRQVFDVFRHAPSRSLFGLLPGPSRPRFLTIQGISAQLSGPLLFGLFSSFPTLLLQLPPFRTDPP